eukprot:6128694-Amphidinium_carterae.2
MKRPVGGYEVQGGSISSLSRNSLGQVLLVAGGAPKARRSWRYVAGTAGTQEGAQQGVQFFETGSGESTPSQHTLRNCHDLAVMLEHFELHNSEAGDSGESTPAEGEGLTPSRFVPDEIQDDDDFGNQVLRQEAAAQALLGNLRLDKFRRHLEAHMEGEPALHPYDEEAEVGQGVETLQQHFLSNPKELAMLIEAHDDEVVTLARIPPPRNIEESTDPYVQAETLYDIMALQEAIRNRWPRMCY